MSKDIPIIFSGPMVRALLEGRKTMTRRLALTSRKLMEESKPGSYRSKTKIMDSPWKSVKPDDQLWVRENFAVQGAKMPIYAATDERPVGPDTGPMKWRPSIHMPRWASRLTLIVTAVKVERLQDISEDDAKAEGVEAISMVDVVRQAAWTNRGDFAQLWNKLHGADAWDANPFVVAVSFRVIKANIDAPESRLAA